MLAAKGEKPLGIQRKYKAQSPPSNSLPCNWDQLGETRDQHETEYIYSSECVVLTLSALDVPEKKLWVRASTVKQKGFLVGVGAGVGLRRKGAFHSVAESHTKLFLLYQIFYRSLNTENSVT